MKFYFSIALSTLFYFSALSSEINIETHVDEVTIYHSGALVKRSGTVTLTEGLNELSFKNISKKMVLNSLKVTNKDLTILNKNIDTKLTEEEFNRLIDQKEALTKQLTLIEKKYEEAGFISKVEDLQKMTDFYLQKTLSIKKSLRDVETKITEARKLENIELENEDAAILKILVSAQKAQTTEISIQYVCGGIGWSPSYDVTVSDASSATLNLKYMARVMSQTGENWNNVQVNLSSAFPLETPTNLPRPKESWVLKQGSFNLDNRNAIGEISNTENLEQIDALKGVQYENIRIPYFLELRVLEGKYSIKSNSTVFTFPILEENLPAKYYYYGFPSLDPQTYLVSEISGWNSLGLVDGVANISYKGNDVGRTVMRFSESEEVLMLPIGKDNSVFLERSEIADKNYFKISNSNKKRKSTLAYQFVVKNNNPFPIQFELADQVPISQSKDAEVEINELSEGVLNEESGDVVWLMNLDAGQAMKQELIFTIEIDSKHRYSSSSYSTRKFRTISCPSF